MHHAIILLYFLHFSHVLRHDQVLNTFAADMKKVFQPSRELWQIGHNVYGIGTLITLMTSTSTEALIAKELFIEYCSAKSTYQDDENNAQYFSFVKFCDECLKLWNCTCDEVRQKQILKLHTSVDCNSRFQPPHIPLLIFSFSLFVAHGILLNCSSIGS